MDFVALKYKLNGKEKKVKLYRINTLIIGSGAAGLNAAIQLYRNGVRDILIVTEGLHMGTSINTGSDKQTYYKLSLYGKDADSPAMMAESYTVGGSMHGDIALIESALSVKAFFNLVNLGVKFPTDRYGQYVGYKTDHDPKQRATSVGPYTSREMCLALINEIKRLKIKVFEKRYAVKLITVEENEKKRVAGAIAVNEKGDFECYQAENIVFAVGGPGGLYKASVYPEVHTGAIGLAFEIGAAAQNLPESQFGMASTKFRWNVSGSYMQVIPRFISIDPDQSDKPYEFLKEYFEDKSEMFTNIFLKGYQWPFDARKVCGGSSIIDILVYIETNLRDRRVFLDYMRDSDEFTFDRLRSEAMEYLKKCNALKNSPIKRLEAMNEPAINLYLDHGIDLRREMLEIDVCAQHNNGGLAADIWWQSINIVHLFPVGEVNGTHGVYRPGGSALNSGQVGGFRLAEFIANRYRNTTLPDLSELFVKSIIEIEEWLFKARNSSKSWKTHLALIRERMTKNAAQIRILSQLKKAEEEARNQYKEIISSGCGYNSKAEISKAVCTKQLCLAHLIYIQAIRYNVESGTGSRGSAIILDNDGIQIHPRLPSEWKIVPENQEFRKKILLTYPSITGEAKNEWIDCRPIPPFDSWFETSWSAYRKGEIYL